MRKMVNSITAYLDTPDEDFLKFNPDLDLVIEVNEVEVVFFGF